MIDQKMFQRLDTMITNFPELHRQRAWQMSRTENADQGVTTCGTTRCAAGWAVWLKAGDLGLITRKRDLLTREHLVEIGRHIGVPVDAFRHVSEMYPVLGAALLGLDDDEAEDLFSDFNNERAADRISSYARTGRDLSDAAIVKYDQS